MRVAFVGKMRSGKDTAAEYFIRRFGGKIVKFADPIYEMEAAIYKILNRPIPEDKTQRRFLLQMLGTEFVRNHIGENTWVNIWADRVDAMSENLYLSDIRFPNELVRAKEKGFKVVKIERSQETRVASGATNTTHASETALDNCPDVDFDLIVSNDGTFEEFYEKLDAFVATFSPLITEIK